MPNQYDDALEELVEEFGDRDDWGPEVFDLAREIGLWDLDGAAEDSPRP